MEAIPAGDWARKYHDLAAQVAELGASHRGTVEVIRSLEGLGDRGLVLCSHAVAHLLPKLLLAQVNPARHTRVHLHLRLEECLQ